MRWICTTVAPWALAGGLLVSFTAVASNDPQAGVSQQALSYPVGDMSSLIPRLGASALIGAAIVEARLRFDLTDDMAADALNVEPRADLKTSAPAFPEVDRTRKGDPLKALRPTLSQRAEEVRRGAGPAGSRLVFNRDERLLPPTILMPGTLENPSLEGETFEPWQAPDLTTTQQTSSVQSPAAAAAGSTGAAVGSATPRVSRALALSSATPAPSDSTPLEIAAAPVSLPVKPKDTSIVAKTDENRPRYTELIDPDNFSKEQRCLAEAVYFEARSESEEGQAAVAQVVLNRVRSGLYPSTICGVVYQNRHRHLACQFTFACEGKVLRVGESESWSQARRVASEVLEGRTYLTDVGGATHYHANYVRPYWARRLKKMDVIGRHIFYKLRPGQT